MEIDGRTRLYGIIGNPVAHTQSPAIHNTLAREMGINMVYVPFHVAGGRLEAALKGAFGLNIYGMNVTVPYKKEVIPFLDGIDERAEKIGAVNTLVRSEKGFTGYNTDISGLMRAMESDGISIKDEEVIILGAGGAGRMAAFMCASGGASRVFLLNRDAEKAEGVAAEVNRKLEPGCVAAVPLADYRRLLGGAENRYIVLQCTSVGLMPDVKDAVIDDGDFYRYVKYGYDLIYTPQETEFMRLVSSNGGAAFNGLKMLLYQGIDAFELWNGCRVSDEAAGRVYRMIGQKLQEKVEK